MEKGGGLPISKNSPLWGGNVGLLNSSCWLENGVGLPISKNCPLWGGNVGKNDIDDFGWEVDRVKHITNEVSFNLIKSLFYINFNWHET